jgi:hypothetical protein
VAFITQPRYNSVQQDSSHTTFSSQTIIVIYQGRPLIHQRIHTPPLSFSAPPFVFFLHKARYPCYHEHILVCWQSSCLTIIPNLHQNSDCNESILTEEQCRPKYLYLHSTRMPSSFLTDFSTERMFPSSNRLIVPSDKTQFRSSHC